MPMQRPEEIDKAIAGLQDFDTVSWYQDWFNAVYVYIENLETKGQCLNEILEYMNDSTVTWRDISDDIINNILKKYNFK
jgi:hypothetical protein